MKLSAGTVINASSQDVWNIISSPAALALWQNGYQSTVMTRGEPGEINSLAKHLFEDKGKKVPVIEKLISSSPT